MNVEWDVDKARTNFIKHKVRFSEAETVLEDDDAITIDDNESEVNEQRFITIGVGAKGLVLVVVFCHRGEGFRIISARMAQANERRQYEEKR